MKIRLAEPTDAPQVARIMTDGWKSTYAGIFPEDYLAGLTYETVQQKWERFLSQPGHFIYVAEETEQKIVAFLAGNCDFPEEGCGFIESFHALSEARGKGVGRKLIETAMAHFRTAGKRAAMVYAIAENGRARAIYTHLGAEVTEYFTDHFDGITTNSVKLRWNLQ